MIIIKLDFAVRVCVFDQFCAGKTGFNMLNMSETTQVSNDPLTALYIMSITLLYVQKYIKLHT